MAAPNALALLISFLKFVFQSAPALAPEIRALCERWCGLKGIPTEDVLPALNDTLTPSVLAADREADALIDTFWPRDPSP